MDVYLELVDRSLEPLRIKTTGGAFRNVTVKDVCTALLMSESNMVTIDGKPSVAGVDVVEPDNTDTLSNVVIPHGTRLTSIPTLLQQRHGIYNRGIGTYFQNFNGKKMWFVYPVYDTERFDDKGKKVIFYAVPQERFPQLDKSYTIDGDLLKIAVTAQKRYVDTAEVALMNAGSGYRMPDARSFMTKPVMLGEDGPKASRANLNHEVAVKERDDNLNFAPVSGASSNPFQQRSAILSRSMAQIDLVWECSDVSLIYPGMPCKFMYLSRGKVISVKGTILFVHGLSSRVENFDASAYTQVCRISIACSALSHLPELPTEETTANGQ